MDRTTESFILAIKRMANRRGMPKIIHSDNASEMVLAKTISNHFTKSSTHQKRIKTLQQSTTLLGSTPQRGPHPIMD